MKEEFEKLYSQEGDNPWTFKEPDKEIISLLDRKLINGDVLVAGCGKGYHFIFFASNVM